MPQKLPSLLLSLTLPLLLTACTDPGPQLSALERCEQSAGFYDKDGSIRYISEIHEDFQAEDTEDTTRQDQILQYCDDAVLEAPENLRAKSMRIRAYQTAEDKTRLKSLLEDYPQDDPTGEALYVRVITDFLIDDVDEYTAEHVPLLELSSEKGFGPSTYSLGRYWERSDLPDDEKYTLALKYFERSSEQGIADGLAKVGVYYDFGYGVAEDEKLANEWYQKAIGLGSAWGMNNYAHNLEWGYGTKMDYGAAADLYRQAYENGSHNAACNLGEIYTSGKGVEQNYKTAFDLFEDAAKNGIERCMAHLAWAYENGRGTEQDYALMRHWARKAAANEHAEAFHYLGKIYRYGMGMNIDYDVAYTYFESGVEFGDAASAAELGEIYQKGLGKTEDMEKSVEYYELAVERENIWAMNRLGELYRDGDQIERDLNRSLEYFFMAVDQDYDDARNNLSAFKDEHGDDPSLDPKLAERLNSPKPDWIR